jgi:hypothetical protein
MVGGIAQEIIARSEVLRIERRLEEACGHLTAIRQAKYKMKGVDTSVCDTEPDGCGSGYESFTTRYDVKIIIQQYLQGLPKMFCFAFYTSVKLSRKCLQFVLWSIFNIPLAAALLKCC